MVTTNGENMTQAQSIMVVDDEPGLRRLLNLLFSNAGYRVIEANSGSDCLKQLETSAVDLIVLEHHDARDGWA